VDVILVGVNQRISVFSAARHSSQTCTTMFGYIAFIPTSVFRLRRPGKQEFQYWR
jgi:hypothetical protein